MRIQVLLSMGQDRLSKEEADDLLDQRVHVLTSNQELHHSTRNFVKLVGGYLGDLSPICLLMALWPRHIDRFKWQYDKAFANRPCVLGLFNGLKILKMGDVTPFSSSPLCSDCPTSWFFVNLCR